MRTLDTYLAPTQKGQFAYLSHHQIKGGKWGRRRWQNPDGSLTPEGRIHYGVGPPRVKKDNPQKTDIHIGKNAKQALTIDYHGGKNGNYDLNDIKNSLKKVGDSVKTAQKNLEAKRIEKAKEKAEAKEKAAKEAEGKRIAAEKLKEEAELAKARSEVDALKEYYVQHPLKIYEAGKVLSKEDIKEVQEKILFERELKDFRRDELMRYVQTAGDVAKALENVYKGADKLKDLYNLGADTYNAFVAAKDPNDNKKPARRIGDGKNMKDTSGKNKNNQNQNNQQQNQKQNDNNQKKEPEQSKQKQNNNTQQSQKNQKKEAEQPKQKNDEKPAYVEKIGDRYFYSKDEVKAYRENEKKQKAFYNDAAAQKEVQDFAKKFYRQYSASTDSARGEFRAALNAKVRGIPASERSPKDMAKIQALYDIIDDIEKKNKNER